MGRRPNPQRKVDLLGEIVEYILDNGLSDLSLRPLAKELGTSTYTLTYQFGSKEAMVVDAVTHIDETQANRYAASDSHSDTAVDIAQKMWDILTADEGLAWSQVMLEVATVTSRQPILFDAFESAAINGRIKRFADALVGEESYGVATARATMWVASINGLVFDLLLTGDANRANEALACLLRTVETNVLLNPEVFDEAARS